MTYGMPSEEDVYADAAEALVRRLAQHLPEVAASIRDAPGALTGVAYALRDLTSVGYLVCPIDHRRQLNELGAELRHAHEAADDLVRHLIEETR